MMARGDKELFFVLSLLENWWLLAVVLASLSPFEEF
jgi:hypothetical protein